jgi:hypothetical protein
MMMLLVLIQQWNHEQRSNFDESVDALCEYVQLFTPTSITIDIYVQEIEQWKRKKRNKMIGELG